jgi:cell wall assembly regulator SMI1
MSSGRCLILLDQEENMKSPTWERIAKEIERISPNTFAALNPPATDEKITLLESKLGVVLPEEFKDYLSTFDGQNSDGEDFPLAGFYRFLDVDGMIRVIDEMSFLFSDEAPIGFLKENKIQPVIWDGLWVPIAEFNASEWLVLDMHAGKNGQDGQLFRYWSGFDSESDEVVCAESFGEFSAELLRRLQNDLFRLEDNCLFFEGDWI